jgi:ADP-L-glycero-D-manno-heptose 6-epimerase
MIIVTGGAGFIGSNLVRGINRSGIDDVVVVDNRRDGQQLTNLSDCTIIDYWDKDRLLAELRSGRRAKPAVIFHQGACAVTTERNVEFMMGANYRYSSDLLDYCLAEQVPLIYASSAAVYGASRSFDESDSTLEQPLNVYGYSKLLFDRLVSQRLASARSQVVGLRYFNVYGPGEAHKGQMASVAYHLTRQLEANGEVCLFEGSGGYAAGEQRRDFVYVDDVVRVNLWFYAHPDKSGIFNVGTGRSTSFNELARAIIDLHGSGSVRYVPFPDGLEASYQSFTQADIGALRRAGYSEPFADVRAGTAAYLEALNTRPLT